MRVQGRIKGEHIAATVHGDDITIGGERAVVEFLIKLMSRKRGRILNRVIELDRDGITIEADQRHVREMLKDLELEPANHSATTCAVERKDEGGARRDERKGRTGTDPDQARAGRHE